MPITASCSNGHSFKARDEFAGKKVRCPQCSTVVVVGGETSGGGTGGAETGKEKAKAPAADPWEIEDPFEAEEPAEQEQSAVKRKGSAKAKAGSGRKKKGTASGGAAKSPLQLIVGVIALGMLIEGGILISRRLQSSRADAPAVAGSPSAPGTPAAPEPAAIVAPPAPAATVALAPVPMPGTPAGSASPMPPGTAAEGKPRELKLPSVDPALVKEIAGYPFPPMTDPGYGPPAPAGVVLSRGLLLNLTEMLLSLMQADGGPGPPPDQMVRNVMTNVAKMRKEDPLMLCLPAAADEALLAGTANLEHIRADFVSARTALLDAKGQIPGMVSLHEEAFNANQLSAGRIAYMTDLLRAKLRKVQGQTK